MGRTVHHALSTAKYPYIKVAGAASCIDFISQCRKEEPVIDHCSLIAGLRSVINSVEKIDELGGKKEVNGMGGERGTVEDAS